MRHNNGLEKGYPMKNNPESESIEQLLAEADDLIRQINSDAILDMQEEHRLQLEIHARELERIKNELEGADLEEKIPKTGSPVDGMHQAILDIVTGMRDLTAYLT